MIQIKRHNLDRYAQEHYDSLHELVKTNIDDFREKLNANKNINRVISSVQEEQIEDLLSHFSANIEVLLKGHLDSISTDLENKFNDLKDLKINLKNSKNKDISWKFPDLMLTIFDYDAFTNKERKPYNAYDLAQKLRVDTCPYCNRQYTSTLVYYTDKVNKTGKKLKKSRVRPDWDHFLPKSEYPYLALSFYNLIPSCQVCNSRLKGAKEFTFKNNLHPYTEGFGNNIKFKLRVNDVNFFNWKMTEENPDNQKEDNYLKYKEAQIKIDIDNAGNLKTKAINNIKIFELDKLYQEHLDYVFELVNKAMIYNDDYIDSLYKQFEGSLFRNREDVLRFVTANYIDDDDLHLRPLSKLTKDIVEQFDL